MSFLSRVRETAAAVSKVTGSRATSKWVDEVVEAAPTAGPGLGPLLESGAWIEEFMHTGQRLTAAALTGLRLSPEQLRAGALRLLVTLDRRVSHGTHISVYGRPELDAVNVLARRKLGWTPEETVLLWWALGQFAGETRWRWYLTDAIRVPLAAAEELTAQGREPLQATIDGWRDSLTGSDPMPMPAADRARLLRRLAALAPPADAGRLPAEVLGDDDPFSAVARAALFTEFGEHACVPLLLHLGRYAGGVSPSKRWRTQLDELLAGDPTGDPTGSRTGGPAGNPAGNPAAGEIAVRLLELTAVHREQLHERQQMQFTWVQPTFVLAANALLLRAAVWAAMAYAHAPTPAGTTNTPGATAESATGRYTRVLAILGDVAVHCGTTMDGATIGELRCTQVTSSVVAALSTDHSPADTGTDAGTDAGPGDWSMVVAQLARIQAKVKNKVLAKAVTGALSTVAARAGVTPGQLVEQSVPTFDLAPFGETEIVLGDHTAVLTVVAAGAVPGQAPGVKIGWRTANGRQLKSVPKDVRDAHATELADLRSRAKNATKVLATERTRIEDLFAADRTWTADEWKSLYLEHPLTAAVARRLIWETSDGHGAWVSGLPTPATATDPAIAHDDPAAAANGSDAGPSRTWFLLDVDDHPQRVDGDAVVRLWHPIRADVDQVAAWRDALTAREFRQPFKQAFREVYLLTPAEETTRVYSNRFAAHVLRYPQAGALIRARGWSGSHLGYWDDGSQGEATKEVGESGWRARFFYDLLENADDEYGTPSLCTTDQVRFERATATAAQPTGQTGRGPATRWDTAPLAEVPPLVFSETMRDIDLFVGVPSIAADPEWTDRGETRYIDYWQRTTFGDLTASASVRRDALARLMPRTRIADQVRISDRFLEVDGTLHTYKIHLGSGNILMSPNDAYLCIVTARGGHDALPRRTEAAGSGRVFLPFEEDGGLLSTIVSKAFLLADDLSITDETILRQIRLR